MSGEDSKVTKQVQIDLESVKGMWFRAGKNNPVGFTTCCLWCRKNNPRERGRRHYCSEECSKAARVEYWRVFRATERDGGAARKAQCEYQRKYRKNPKSRDRLRIVERAKYWAPYLQMSPADVLKAWGHPPGKASTVVPPPRSSDACNSA